MDSSQKKSRLGGVLKKAVGCVAVGALAASLSAGAAFATDQLSATYALPTASQVKSFQHTETGNNGQSYTYEYVTIGSSATGRVAPMAQTYYEVMGLNYINAYRGPDSIFASFNADGSANPAGGINSTYTTGTVGALQTRNSTLAIMGTNNNVAPDEYIWNYCCWANGATVATDQMALDHGNSNAVGTGKVSVTIGGTEYADFPRDVYMECNIIAQTDSTATYGDTSYLQWIELENQRDNRTRTGTYDPDFAKYSAQHGGGAKMVAGLHTLANTVDSVVAQHVDANGNYTLQSRYGGNQANGTGASIDKYEDLVQATQYYTLSKIADGTIEQAVTADVVGYDPTTGNYACRKYAVNEADKDANVYGGRLAGYLASISKSITDLGLEPAQDVSVAAEADYVVWYTPQQIVENADAVFTCDAYSSNNISTYLATATDGSCYVAYSPATVGSEEEDRTAGLIIAQTTAKAAGKDTADFCFSYPANMFGNVYAQGVENGMLALITSSFTYPEIFGSSGLTDLFAYWAKNVWHITDSSLQSIVESTTSYMSMTGLEIGKISANFEENAEKIFNEGNWYYLQNKETVDAINYGNLKTFDAEKLAARTTEPTPDKQANPIKVTGKTVTAKAKAKTTFAKAKAFTINNAQGAVTFKKTSGDSKITVANGGKVTVKKGLKSGKTYKVKVAVTAAGNDKYEAGTVNATLKVKVK